MRVAGIDYSSHAIDVVLVDLDDQQPPVWRRYDLVGQDAFDRTRYVRTAMPFRTAPVWDDVLAIGIEHPAGKFGTGIMMRLQGAVLACLPSGVLVQPWTPASWRKAVGLAGNATKAQIANEVYRTRCSNAPNPGWYPRTLEDWPQDACDAYSIALATRAAIVRSEAA